MNTNEVEYDGLFYKIDSEAKTATLSRSNGSNPVFRQAQVLFDFKIPSVMYYNDEPYAILNLKDTRDCQIFDVGTLGYEDKSNAPAWTIKFEIMEVYPGDKYQDTAITEIYFDGIDVH